MENADIRKALERLGYRIIYRATGWYECLVAREGESWNGSGVDSEGALADAMRKMFPSKAAREAFEHYQKALVVLDQKVISATYQEEEKADPPPKKKSPDTMVVYDHPSSPLSQPDPTPPVVEVSAPPELVTATMTVEEAFERLEEIVQEIDVSREDFAVMSSQNQRLTVASWIFQGRSIEEQFKSNRAIAEKVHDIARSLTDVCKDFWPGSVQALQVDTPPSRSLVGLVKFERQPKDWGDAAEALEEAIEESTRNGHYDIHGWMDFGATNPPPTDASKVLEEAVGIVEGILGSVNETPDEKDVRGLKIVLPERYEELAQAASLLRWIRPRCRDQVRWGLAFGKLRWASKFRLKNANKLAAIVDPKFKPEKTWAQLLDRDPEVRRKRRLRAKVMAVLPVKKWRVEQVMEWLEDAFPVFTNPQLAKMTSEVHQKILQLEIQDFADADRNIRSRFMKLQKMLSAGQDVSDVKLPEVHEGDLSDEIEETAATTTVLTAAELVLEGVRTITSGKKMMFVSNRDDQILKRALEKDLDCKVVMKDGGSSRKMASTIEAVKRGSYDMILMATGFNNHTADAILSRAAKGLGIPYVRVNKGRPSATARAIAKAFNVGANGNGPDKLNQIHAN
jgi:hypothetical protein